MNDFISRRKAVLALLKETHKDGAYGYLDGKQAEDVIMALPAEQQWIPVSERLPEDFQEVIITWVNRDPELFYAHIKDKPFTGAAVYFGGRWFWYSARCQDYLKEYGSCYGDEMDYAIEVIAWMPLPEPYKEEQE